MEESNKPVLEIEKLADLKAQAQEQIVFDNAGNMHVDNREYHRNFKGLWRSVREGHKSIRHFTKQNNAKTKAQKKRERQNKKKGRK